MLLSKSGGSFDHYTTVPRAVRQILRTEGVRGMYRGVSAMALGAGPAHAVYFAAYEKSKQILMGPGKTTVDPGVAALSGALATVVSDAVALPMDVVKQRLQLPASPYKGVWDCVSRVTREEGLQTFFSLVECAVDRLQNMVAHRNTVYFQLNFFLTKHRPAIVRWFLGVPMIKSTSDHLCEQMSFQRFQSPPHQYEMQRTYLPFRHALTPTWRASVRLVLMLSRDFTQCRCTVCLKLCEQLLGAPPVVSRRIGYPARDERRVTPTQLVGYRLTWSPLDVGVWR
eukprot:9148673-Pyramimonas_sp.AAC.1